MAKQDAKTRDEVIVVLATELSRCRVLSDQESRWLERSLREHDRRAGGVGYYGTKDRWTRQDDAQVCAMTSDGRTANEIARELKRTPMSVRSRVRFLRRRGKMALRVEVRNGG